RTGADEGEGTAGGDGERRRYGGRARDGAGARALDREGLGSGAPDVDVTETHGAGGSDGDIDLRDGAGDGGTRALIAGGVHGGDGDSVRRASNETREPEADCLIRRRSGGRGGDRKEGCPGAGCRRSPVIDAI